MDIKKMGFIKNVLAIASIGLLFTACFDPKDIRNKYIKNELIHTDTQKAADILLKMENAHGGRENWAKFNTGKFVQIADWYGKLKQSHWDTLPQKFEMVCELGNNNTRLTLLNGKNKGKKYQLKNNSLLVLNENNEWVNSDQIAYYNKMDFKSYWFQFPFRIREAQIIRYAGVQEIDGVKYDLLFASWKSEKANKEFDQFLLYINQANSRLEILHFTVRDVMTKIAMTTEFKNFKTINGMVLPMDQYVRLGKPEKNGHKVHENHYISIEFSEVSVKR